MKFSTFGPGPETGSVATAALARGHVRDDSSPDVAYIRTRTFPPWRDAGLELIASLHARGIPTLPSYEDSLLYDNKVAQVVALRQWLPRTILGVQDEVGRLGEVSHVGDGGTFPRTILGLPFVSKSSRGAGSKNVRLIRTREEAEAEIRAAFGEGIKAHRELQRGYLIWQEFIEGNDHDIRVVINGDHLYGLIRYNRSAEVPFASGSGKIEVIQNLVDRSRSTWPLRDVRAYEAFKMAREISYALGTRWACYDFVFRNLKTYVLEVSFSWVEGAYAECPCFDVATLEPNGHTAAEWATFAVMEMERMVSNA